ncbi:putative transposase [Senna tora]|uniref:Putative transposase n=1 Tax=Senna tora TaxID=362788 RepID=A0A834SC09_9FABA|nr:putative transposase [Senna tora]
MQERLLRSKLKESKGGCHQRQCQKKPALPKTSTQAESQRVQGHQSQYNKVDTTKKPNQNVAEVQQSNEAPHVPKKLKRKPMCPPLSMDDFLGPREKIVKDLSLFLGTMARNSTFCPFTYNNWKAMPSDLKDNMWKYINEKFNVPDEGKKWVKSTIQDAWRRYKCKIKKLHFEKFANMTKRLKHRPATIPESHFKKLCLYWSNENVKSQLKVHLTQTPEQNHTEALKEVFGKEKAGRVRCYGMNMENLDVFFRSFPSEANNAQNDEGQCNEHSTTYSSNPDKGQLGEKDASFYEAH